MTFLQECEHNSSVQGDVSNHPYQQRLHHTSRHRRNIWADTAILCIMSYAGTQRRADILAELLQRKHVTVRNLAARMEVSEATVRRDLRTMAAQKEVTLVHGGATLRRQNDFSFQAKSARSPEAKCVIGELAANLVGDGDQVFIDSGTTCFQMIPTLRRREHVSVLATSLRLAMEIEAPGLHIILLGGQYRTTRMDTVGPVALAALEHLRGYSAFIGADGLSREFGPSASDIDSAHLHQHIVKNARKTILLADQKKFDEPSLFRIAQWDQVDKVITECGPSDDWIKFFEKQRIELIYPDGVRRDAKEPEY